MAIAAFWAAIWYLFKVVYMGHFGDLLYKDSSYESFDIPIYLDFVFMLFICTYSDLVE